MTRVTTKEVSLSQRSGHFVQALEVVVVVVAAAAAACSQSVSN